MKKELDYRTRGVCSRMIHVEVEDGIVTEARFLGGCNGNTQGVAALVKGMAVTDAIERLTGIDCNGRGTSCPDQLANALREVLK